MAKKYSPLMLSLGIFGFFFCFPILELVSKIKRFYPSGLRRKKNSMQTAIITYQHKQTGRKVLLVGVTHFGQERYYRTIQELLEDFERNGYKVLYECIKGTSDDISGNENIKGKAKLKSDQKSTFKLVEFLGVAFQFEALKIKDSWINTDMSARQYVEDLSQSNIQLSVINENSKVVDSFFHFVENSFWKPILLNRFPLIYMGFILLSRFLRIMQRKGAYVITIDKRDILAAEAIKKYCEQGDVVALWGADHLDRIPFLLKREGFEEKSKAWVTVYQR